MNDAPRRARALTAHERATLSTVEEIQIAQSKPVEVSPQRTLPPATDAAGRFMHAMEPHIGESAKDQMAAALGILLGELGRLERTVTAQCVTIVGLETKLTEIQTEYDNIRDFAIRDCGVWRHGQRYERNSLVTDGGAAWIAKSDTSNRPPGDDWRMAQKSDGSRQRSTRSGR